MSKLQLILTIGAPRSGKDTWADKFIAEHEFGYLWVKVNRDILRRELFGFAAWSEYKFSKEKEKTVTECQFSIMERAYEDGYNIICSDTNINPATVEKFKRWAEEHDYEISFQHFDVPLHILEQRNADSQFGVSPQVLVDMWLRYKELYGRKYVPNKDNPPAIIVDIDGTIAEHTGIRKPYEWHKVGLDRTRDNVCNLVRLMYGHTMIILLSGRDGVCRPETQQWLKDNNIPYNQLLMRAAGDSRSDYIIKEELFDQVKDDYNILFAVDDRDQVVNLWRSMGLECWQVNYGKF